MSKVNPKQPISRRDFLKVGAGAFGVAAGSLVGAKALLKPVEVARASRPLRIEPAPAADLLGQTEPVNLHLVATDGWIYIPPPDYPPYHPDNFAPAPFTTYVFGYRDVTSYMNDSQKIIAQKMKCQLAAPFMILNQEEDFVMKLTNLGLQMRPDLIDSHTVHFHGFRNAIPIFDGEPHSSTGVPIIRDLTYFYRPHNPGTYLYHCHFEETEHVHMGMVGMAFIRPLQNGNTSLYPSGKYVFNDGDGSTGYDREFVMVLNEVWYESHWSDSHVQLPEWTEYDPQLFLLNGRVYPDTIAPNGGGVDPATGDLIPPDGRPELQYQPVSSLVTANAGERVLLRISSIGFFDSTMVMPGIKMRIVGRDAMHLVGRDGTDQTATTSAVSINTGESADVIFDAPAYHGPGPYDTYLFYNRRYGHLSNSGGAGYGGQMTEVHIYPPGTLPPQTEPNT